MNNNYRAYFWGNMYLSSLQQGLQAAHCLGEMVMASRLGGFSEQQTQILHDWLQHDKTIILLNGGYASNITEIHQIIKDTTDALNGSMRSNLPHAIFHEEHDALNGAATSVGIILPESIWELSYYSAEHIADDRLLSLLKSSSLAR